VTGEGFLTGGIYTRQKRPRDIRELYQENATHAIEGFDHQTEIFGLTKGQFSLIQLICACLDVSGPAATVISTWTAAKKEIDSAGRLLADGRITTLRLLVDASFPARQPVYCAKMRARFGDRAIRVTQNHAKFVLMRNAKWDIVLRSSMNLNKNSRLEFFELGNDRALAEFLEGVVRKVFRIQKPTVGFERRADSEKEFRERLESSRHGNEGDLIDWQELGTKPMEW
jgi:hypothetical protein